MSGVLRLDCLAYGVGPAPGTPIIHDASARIDLARRTVVLGPNGAGKSVLLRLCMGLLQANAGTVAWDGFHEPPRRALVFQRPVLLRRSALANVEYPLVLAGVLRKQARAQALIALESVGLGSMATRPARQLSGGEQQRLALARAWVTEPQVLLLDEPTSQLDPGSAREVEAIIGSIHAAGVGVVMTTHNIAQARRLADDVVFVAHGRIVEAGPAAAFFRTPLSESARAFLNEESIWR